MVNRFFNVKMVEATFNQGAFSVIMILRVKLCLKPYRRWLEGGIVILMVVSQHSQDTFYQDQEVMADFLDYITFLLNHVNPHTGLGEIKDQRGHIH